MQGKKTFTPQLFVSVNLLDLVPADNFYRKLLTELDLHFIYKATQKYYGKEGQESIDPVVFFKLLLVGYLNNINSDRLYGLVDQNKKGTPVKSPNENSLEFQLASRGIDNAFITLAKSGNKSFFSQGPVLRLFDHHSAASSKQWDKIIDAVFFIQTMKPAEEYLNYYF